MDFRVGLLYVSPPPPLMLVMLHRRQTIKICFISHLNLPPYVATVSAPNCRDPPASPSNSWTHLITSKKQHTHTRSHKERCAVAVTKYIPDIRLAALLSALSQIAARQQQQQQHQQWAEAAAATAEKFVSQTSCGLGQLGLPAAAAGRGLSRFTGFWYLVCQLCFLLSFFISVPLLPCSHQARAELTVLRSANLPCDLLIDFETIF